MTEPALVRLDVWLWAARFFKTRALSRKAIDTSRVQIDGQACKAGRPVRIGDMLQLRRGEEQFQIEVLALSRTRGPATVAQTLYQEGQDSRIARLAAREQRRLAVAPAPPGRPDKKARRALTRLRRL